MWWLLEIKGRGKWRGRIKREKEKKKQKKKKDGREKNLKETKLHIKTWNMSKTNHDLLGLHPKLVLTINSISMLWHIYHENIIFLVFLYVLIQFFLSWDFGKLIRDQNVHKLNLPLYDITIAMKYHLFNTRRNTNPSKYTTCHPVFRAWKLFTNTLRKLDYNNN